MGVGHHDDLSLIHICSLTIEATGDDAKLRGLEDLLRAYGIKETVRTGKVALSRSSRD